MFMISAGSLFSDQSNNDQNTLAKIKKQQHFYNKKKVLVTGGAGFIGPHLVEKLIEYGADVTVLDDLSTGSLKNISKIKNNIAFIQGDITNYQTCLDATQKNEIIFHLAAFTSVPESINNPQSCFKINVIGTMNLLRAATVHNIKRFIFSSSSAVYGPQTELCHEAMNCRPQSPYGHSKLIGEQLCHHFYQTNNIEIVILRYFNAYGSNQNSIGPYSGVITKFKKSMQQNTPITIFGDGKQTRDFVSVEKIAEANIIVAMAPHYNVAGQIFNIANGKSISLLQLIEQLKTVFPQFSAGINFAPPRTGEIKYSHADISKYQQLLLGINSW